MTNVYSSAPGRARRSLRRRAALGASVATVFFGLSGPATSQEIQPRLGQPVPGLTAAERALFDAGLVAFDTTLADADGLGPIMNDVSCVGCHSQPVSGGFSTRTVTRFGKAASGGMAFDPLAGLGGSLLQEQTIDLPCAEVVPPEATVTAQRLTPGVFGLGLMESIVDQDILDNEANQPAGLSGFVRMNQPIEGGPMRPGRFGWKGGVSTVFTFSADASLNEMGLTSTWFPNENAPNGNLALLAACDSVADPEDQPDLLGFTMIDRFTHFQRYLAAPPQTPKSGMTGEALFHQVGCADCHLSAPYVTSNATEPALDGVSIKPYSDFLLHDMGSLGDGIVDGPATETIMMTRPLWGLHQRLSFLHDGSATGGTFNQNIDAAIMAHDGEAAASRDDYDQNLSPAEKDMIAEFIFSLGRVEFDWEADNDVDWIDWFFMESLFTGPGVLVTPDDAAAVSDIDQDGDVDLRDFGMMQRAFTGEIL